MSYKDEHFYKARIELSRDGSCKLIEEGHINSICLDQWNDYRKKAIEFVEASLIKERAVITNLALEIVLRDITP
ncbi:MAG: hypothetical protein WC584_04405 [Candidatus Pacearchaeota archaeon]